MVEVRAGLDRSPLRRSIRHLLSSAPTYKALSSPVTRFRFARHHGKSLTIVVAPPASSGLSRLPSLAQPAVDVLANTVLVLILTIFFLARRESIRRNVGPVIPRPVASPPDRLPLYRRVIVTSPPSNWGRRLTRSEVPISRLRAIGSCSLAWAGRGLADSLNFVL
jgi:hypothetical protein